MSHIHTRFAPSPTGMLHIGGLRTALFAWMLARSNNGTFSLRIEDTDQERNTPEAVQAILDGLAWAGIDHDAPIVYQSHNIDRHRAVVQDLLDRGLAYRCALTNDELTAQREAAAKSKRPFLVRSPWRDTPAPADMPCVVRLRAPQTGNTEFTDLVRGACSRSNQQMDDMVLMRSDGTPTYMLAVVVDDHDVGVNTIIRGDDHHTNTFRQVALLNALGWDVPTYAHLPLVNDQSGKKLSKRDGKAGLEYYQDQGILPEALCTLLMRIGWDGAITDTMTIREIAESGVFTTDGIQRSPGRLDEKRLAQLGRQWMRHLDRNNVIARIHRAWSIPPIPDVAFNAIVDDIIERSTSLEDAISQMVYIIAPANPDEKARSALDRVDIRTKLADAFAAITPVNGYYTREQARSILWDADSGKPNPAYGPVVRAALTGKLHTPPLDTIVLGLPADELIRRLRGNA